jgi:MarR family transcriptional repressor of emrRAB
MLVKDDRFERIRSHIREHAQSTMGSGKIDTSGIELFCLLHMVENYFENQETERIQARDLSAPRWSILLRLLTEENKGNPAITPTYLSRCQNVSKNTISSLLRGLEDKGLINRTLDNADKRTFHIRLTESGRALILSCTPAHFAHLNYLVSDLNGEEKEQLVGLLRKLYLSLLSHSHLQTLNGG